MSITTQRGDGGQTELMFGRQVAKTHPSVAAYGEVDELNSRLRQEDQNIQYYKTAALPEAEALLKTAQVQFKESETSIIQFVESINSANEIKRNYIEAVYAYNIAELELELYTE